MTINSRLYEKSKMRWARINGFLRLKRGFTKTRECYNAITVSSQIFRKSQGIGRLLPVMNSNGFRPSGKREATLKRSACFSS